MADALNLLGAARIRHMAEIAAKGIKARTARAPNPEQRDETFYLWMGELRFNLGAAACFEQTGHKAVRAEFEKAAQAWSMELGIRAAPNAQTNRNPTQSLRRLAMITCFGDPDQWPSLGALTAEQLHWPQDRHQLAAQAVDLLRIRLATGGVDGDLAKKIGVQAASPEADRYEVEVIGPVADALLAIDAKSGTRLAAALTSIVGAHRREALEGAYRHQLEGVIEMTALALLKLARDAGVDCDFESPYVPRELLG